MRSTAARKKTKPKVKTLPKLKTSPNRLALFLSHLFHSPALTIGLVTTVIGLAFLSIIYWPVLKAELNYAFHKPSQKVQVASRQANINPDLPVIFPVDESFGIVIPKIGANSRIIANVNPFNIGEYQWALTKGIAHARGTVYPGQSGNIFLFAHSAGNFYEANQFNAVFYLLTKLEKHDEIFLFYNGNRYRYLVTDKKIVSEKDVSYLSSGDNSSNKVVTLMTCWPPGTTISRLIVTAKLL